MNKYAGLLSSIAQKHSIFKGNNEPENEWKARIVYSVCGMMAYSSLWDETDEEDVSITHIKHRVAAVFDSYKQLFPEISSCFPADSDELGDEIIKAFLNNGIVYHRPNRIHPSKECSASFGKICFQRGINIDSIAGVSGIGFYSLDNSSNNLTTVNNMFAFEEHSLAEQWKQITLHARWKSSEDFENSTEYLKMEPPYTRGYWINKPYKNGDTFILRTGLLGAKIYYLYRYIDDSIEISALPSWQVGEYQYRALANACLFYKNTLPSIDYSIDGRLVHIHINYLLPPREQNFIKLYSWPERCTSVLSDFNRKCDLNVFEAIKHILSAKGYEFIQR
ncbi:MAG: hypothetical protein J6A37_12535 [Oscillospiraceae bacterium]|nr:hypothetical protein [Oscillospiraceae bacterium]